MQQSKNRHSVFKLAFLCLGILLLGSFWFTIREMPESAGIAVITQAPRESEPVTATFKPSNPSLMREQLDVSVRTESETGSDVKIQSSPPYPPPQLGTSFLSFASFSTLVMSPMSTMAYYQSNFSSDMGLNVGTIITVVLIVLLILLELTQPVIQGKTAVLRRLRIRFSTVTWILSIIFIGIVYTKAVMILAT